MFLKKQTYYRLCPKSGPAQTVYVATIVEPPPAPAPLRSPPAPPGPPPTGQPSVSQEQAQAAVSSAIDLLNGIFGLFFKWTSGSGFVHVVELICNPNHEEIDGY